ncbi:hypothetical protein [Paenibacillus senegalensis]|uniref:hypothetical protein n=1 Tax=Paenibacillus senegalensis TaxID=1465766 RepID=UPI0002896F03|nr:hypothetical protein [Paenibacillus senegalensis]
MKKTLGMIVAAAMIASGCSAAGGEQNSPEPKKTNESVAEGGQSQAGEGIEVDKKLLNVSITLPASMFEDQDLEQITEDAKKQGVKEVVKNDDGSVTYTMSKSDHSKMLKEMGDEIAKFADELVNEATFASIKNIKYNDSFSEFSLIVNKEAYENSMDGLVMMGMGMQGMMYQMFSGVDADKQKVTINVEDESTGEIFHTLVYPDGMNTE